MSEQDEIKAILDHVSTPMHDPSKYYLKPDEIILRESHLDAIKYCIEYYEHKSVYYDYQPTTKKEFMQILAEIKRDVLRALREKRHE